VIVVTVARKPVEGSVTANVEKWGTGALNLGACRIGDALITINRWSDGAKPFGGGSGHPFHSKVTRGRWPSNLIFQRVSEEKTPSSNCPTVALVLQDEKADTRQESIIDFFKQVGGGEDAPV